MRYIISACLTGTPCKYNGENNLNPNIAQLAKETNSFSVCPEILGGLPVPRARVELKNGSGKDVIAGSLRVVNEHGDDVTAKLLDGARQVLTLAHKTGISSAILKARSPSCGCGIIYDGTFTGNTKNGNGVLAELLVTNGIRVITEEEFI